jgi:hypothetical protein
VAQQFLGSAEQRVCPQHSTQRKRQSSPAIPIHQTSHHVILFCFPKCSWRSRTAKEIRVRWQDVLKMLMQNDFHQWFQSQKSCWNRCTNAEGDYFKGDGGEISIYV